MLSILQRRLRAVLALLFLVSTVHGELSTKRCYLTGHLCFLDPCILATCPKYGNAVKCRDYKCGRHCIAEFWYNGKEVTSDCQVGQADSVTEALLTAIFSADPEYKLRTKGSTSDVVNVKPAAKLGPDGCPLDRPRVACYVRPCAVTKCPGKPAAFCNDDYCGGCSARFTLGNVDVTSQCKLPSVQQAPPYRPPAVPYPSPINTNRGDSTGPLMQNLQALDNVGGAVPTSRGTGGSNEVNGCPSQLVTRCTFVPCAVSSCRVYPRAVCRNSNCGGCFARYYYRGQEVTSMCRQQSRALSSSSLYPMMFMGDIIW